MMADAKILEWASCIQMHPSHEVCLYGEMIRLEPGIGCNNCGAETDAQSALEPDPFDAGGLESLQAECLAIRETEQQGESS